MLIKDATSSIGLASIIYAKRQGANVIATSRKEENRSRLLDMSAGLLNKGQLPRIHSKIF